MNVVKILVISDTHVPSMIQRLPARVMEQARSCRIVIHAGDCVSKKALDELSKVAVVFAVRGNQELPELAPILPTKLTLNMEGFRIGVVHGHQGRGLTTLERVKDEFENEKV